MTEHYHPNVASAIAAREKIDRIEAFRDREPEPDLKTAVRELAQIVEGLCAHALSAAIARGATPSVIQELDRAEDAAVAIVRRLR